MVPFLVQGGDFPGSRDVCLEDVVWSNDVGAPQVRNLTYMVTRREKMKRSLWKVQEQIFQQQVRLLDQQLISG